MIAKALSRMMEPLDKLWRFLSGVKIPALNLHQLFRWFSPNPQGYGVFFNPEQMGMSDKDKPTVGPWGVQVLGRNLYVESIRANRGVAAVMWSPESEANARLIAAAPELLTECVYVLSLLERGDLNGLRDEVAHLRLLVDKVRNGDEERLDRPEDSSL